MGFIKFSTVTIMIALFSISLITFAINFAVDNDASITLEDDGTYNNAKAETQTDVEEFYSGSTTAFDSYQQSTISSQTEASEGGTQFKVTPATSVSMTKRTLTTAWKNIFGADSGFGIVLTALISILSLITIAYAYKAWVGRNPD